MYKKLLFSILTIAIIGSIPSFSHDVAAQEVKVGQAMPIYNDAHVLPFGQNHAYTVTLRGNAEAVVSMKAIFTNYEESTASAMTFQIPKGEVRDVSAFQVVQEPQCIRYDYQNQPIQLDVVGDQSLTQTSIAPTCTEYREPNYYNAYDYGTVSYLKADVYTDGNSITVSLPHGVSPQNSGSIVLYYRGTGYVKKDTFGAFVYAFETLKTDTAIRNLTVGITTDTDLKLEGADATVNYETVATVPLLTTDSSMGKSIRSPEFDSYYQRIGGGRITKTATDLQPLDTFTVTGRYAKSSMQLYGKKITVGSLLGLGLLLFLIAVIHKMIQRFSRSRATTGSKVPPASQMSSVLISSGAALLSSLLAAAYTIGLYVFSTILNRGYYSKVNNIIVLFVLLISCILYILCIFGPAIFVGWKRGVWWGVGTIGITVLLLCMYLGVFIMYSFFNTQTYPSPVYMNAEPMRVDAGPYMK